VIRIGQSTDIHALVHERKLILGGLEIPYEKGLLGHSDADVLLHAIAEAIIGALGLGDLGEHFPDNSAANKDLDSRRIMAFVVELLQTHKYEIVNIDTLIMAQAPKLLPYKQQMRTQVAAQLGISVEQVNIKATTGERLGFIGRGEGILAQAVVLIESTV
jgi:2-C-methyl-D-erythritol 2,4-cyclodiphosphate synthase